MANSNFIVQNGLTVGPLTIDAATGSITTSGAINSTSGITVITQELVLGTEVVAGNLVANSGTASTNTTTGALVVAGGAGVSGAVNIGSTLGVTGVSTLSGNVVAASGTASTSTTTGALVVAGGAGVSGAIYAGSVQNTPIGSTTASTGTFTSLTATGATTLANVTTGGITSNGTVNCSLVQATTIGNSGATLTGTLSTASQPNVTTLAGLTSAGASGATTTVQGNLTVAGNLTVQGINTIISSQDLTINDSVLNLHTFANLAPLASDDAKDVGFKFHYYKAFSGGDNLAFLGWQNSTGFLEYFASGSEGVGNVFTGGTQGTIKSGEYISSNTTASTSTTTGAIQTAGGLGVGGAINVGSTIKSAGNIVAASGTATSSTTTGALVVAGGAGVSGDVYVGGNVNITGGQYIVPTTSNTAVIGSLTNWFNQVYAKNFYGTSTTANYADLAENYQADRSYTPGTVVMFGGAAEVTVADADTTAVAGVVSTNPAHLMNGSLSGPNVVPLALQGRVPCQVIGPVKKGDLMVSAGFGYAKANNNASVGQVIGKALQDFAGSSKAVIEVVVGRI